MNREQRERHEKGEKRLYKPSRFSRVSRLKSTRDTPFFLTRPRTGCSLKALLMGSCQVVRPRGRGPEKGKSRTFG